MTTFGFESPEFLYPEDEAIDRVLDLVFMHGSGEACNAGVSVQRVYGMIRQGMSPAEALKRYIDEYPQHLSSPEFRTGYHEIIKPADID